MADSEKVMTVTDGSFSEEVESTSGLTIVDFWAAWCGPCRMVAPIVAELAEEYAEQGLRVGKLDVDQNQMTASRFGVRSIPSILFFKDGKHVDTVVGAVPRPYLEAKVNEHL
ncbi:thioredoxin [Gemmatimonadota bacterium]